MFEQDANGGGAVVVGSQMKWCSLGFIFLFVYVGTI